MITIGFDTEFSLHGASAFKPISAVGKIGGTKKAPIPFKEFIKRYPSYKIYPTREWFIKDCFIQEDNVNVEVNTAVAHNKEELVTVLRSHPIMAQIVLECTGYIYNFRDSAIWYDSSELQSDEAQTFGCDPDFNAWDGKMNQSPKRNTNMRTKGCHIHIGYDNPTIEKSREIVKFLDVIFGLGSIAWNSQRERITMYGKPGAFRIKDYGVEYRFLPSLFAQVFGIVLPIELEPNSDVKKWGASVETKAEFLFSIIENTVSLVEHGITVESVLNDDFLTLIRASMAMNDSFSALKIIDSKHYKEFIIQNYTEDTYSFLNTIFTNMSFYRRYSA